MLQNFLLVGLGGAIGSMARYGIYILMKNIRFSSSLINFPFPTLTINILGSFIIGVLFGLSIKQNWLQDWGWSLLAVGICGGFTTFSTFSLDNINLFQKETPIFALAYIGISVILGIVFCKIGINIIK